MPPHATYLFKHALVQDAAYGTLLREPRRALHARIAETLESHFAEIAENQPEILARHCTEAGLIEKAAGLWGKAGQRSLERSALVEAVAQFTRALDQIATLPGTPALRREADQTSSGAHHASPPHQRVCLDRTVRRREASYLSFVTRQKADFAKIFLRAFISSRQACSDHYPKATVSDGGATCRDGP